VNPATPDIPYIYNNLLLSTNWSCVTVWLANSLTNAFIYNNTIVGITNSQIQAIQTGATNTILSNNIISHWLRAVENDNDYLTNSVQFSDRNIFYDISIITANGLSGSAIVGSPYYPAGCTLPQWRLLGYDVNTITNNPLLNANYTLQSNSPAIGMGANLSSVFTNDYTYATRPASGAWDVGAFQWVPVGNVGPTITVQPTSHSVVAPATATFSVTATGTPTLAYQWDWYGTNVTGATSASWTTPATTTANNGSSVYVTVSNAYGSVQSMTVALLVNSQGSATISGGATFNGILQ
jgi:hypothetical protein